MYSSRLNQFSTIIALLCGYDLAFAQDSQNSTATLEEITVTAQKRAESLQEVPLTVTAIGSEEIDRQRIRAVEDLQGLAPGLTFGQHSGFSRLFVRGIGLTSISAAQDPSVALQVDGVVIGRPFAQLSSFYDLERIEVLRGPQGTLYGRNATGGNVNLITASPTAELTGYLDLTVGNYDLRQLEGAISGPLTNDQSVRGRLAVQTIQRDGYAENQFLNQDIESRDNWAVRAKLEADITEKLNLLVSADFAKEDDASYGFTGFGGYREDTELVGVILGGSTLVGTRDILSDVTVVNDREFLGAMATISYDLSDSLRLRSITGYRNSERYAVGDPDITSGAAFSPTERAETSEQWSQELQLHYSSERLDGVVGLYYYNEEIEQDLSLLFLGVGGFLGFPEAEFHEDGSADVSAYAVFTQWTYRATDDLGFTAGVRYSDESRESTGVFTIFNFQPPPNGANVVIPLDFDEQWDAVTPKIGIDYSVSPDVMLYASATRGFKSGAVSIGSPNPPVDPEFVWAYEAGVKSTLFEGTTELNAALFSYDYEDLQVNRVVGNSITTVNAATASIEGFEVEFRSRVTENFFVSGDVTYLDARFDEFITGHPALPEQGDFDLSGNHLSNAPEFMANLSAELDLAVNTAGRFSVRADLKWTDEYYFTEFNEERISQDAAGIWDLSLRYEDAAEKWRFTLFAKNLTDEDIASNIFVAAAATGYAINGGWKPPRTYGVTLGYRF